MPPTPRHDNSGLRQPLPKTWSRRRHAETRAPLNTPPLPEARFLPSEKRPAPASQRAGRGPERRAARQAAHGGRLTFTWLGSPGLPPSGGFVALLSARGRTTCRKGLLSGKPLTLIPSGRKGRTEGVRRAAGILEGRRAVRNWSDRQEPPEPPACPIGAGALPGVGPVSTQPLLLQRTR